MSIQAVIEKIKKQTGIPYIDVICYQRHKEIFRYVSGGTGKERLYMYSCGKPVTVTSALRLVQEGKLRLDDRVCDYLPAVKDAFILDEKGEKRIVGEQMKIRHLFTMSAGFSYNLATEPICTLAKESEGKATLQDFIPKFVETPLLFVPGERFEYSLCHDVLAAVAEKVSGKKFSQFIQETIFTPLGMKNSHFDNSEKGVADLYFAYDDGRVERVDEGKILLPTPAYESGGAGLSSTVEDYIRFADALACKGEGANGYRLVDEETVRLLATTQISCAVENGFTCVQGQDYGYGLGVRVRQTPTPWGLSEGEFGWDGAAGAYLMVDPERELAVVMGMHVRNWPAVFKDKHLEIVKSIYKQFFIEV